MSYAKRFGPSKALGLNIKPSLTGPEAATQSFKKGALLIDSSGYLAEGGTDPTNIIGVSEEAASGTTGNDVRFTPALPNVLFEGRLLGAAAADHVLVATNRYAEYGLTKDSDGYWYVNVSKTGADARFRILEFVDAVGTTNARVRGVFTLDQTVFEAS